MLLAIITLLAGILLGTRFTYLVIVPATMFLSVAILAASAAHAESIGSIALAVVIASVGLQVGYVFGLFVHQGLLAFRASFRRGTPSSQSTVSQHVR
jgi:hypothetical protein